MANTALKIRSDIPAIEYDPEARNQLFLLGGDPATLHNPFAGTEVVNPTPSDPTSPAHRAAVTLFGQAHRLRQTYDPHTDRAIACWGLAPHPAITDSNQMLRWVSDVVSSDDLSPLQQLLGTFVIVIDDRRHQQVTLVNDVLGLRPMYVGRYRNRLVAGSDVLAICRAGLSDGQANYDAIAAWLWCNHPIEGDSVVTDYRLLDPMSVRTFDPAGRIVRDRTYGPLPVGRIDAPQTQVVDESVQAASDALLPQLRDHPEINFPLSGGYDSRLLFALACERSQAALLASTLCTRQIEADLATQVAEALGHPLELLRARTRILDLFDDPIVATPGGFVSGRNLTSFLARQRPAMPVVSGFMGDGTMRGSLMAIGNAHFAKDDQPLSNDQYVDALMKRFAMLAHRPRLLRKPLAERIQSRTRQSLYALVEKGRAFGKPMLYADLFSRHRFYYSNVFLQHLDTAEAITPFASWGVLSARVRYATSAYNERSYPMAFERHFPKLQHIPHTTDRDKVPGGAKHPAAAPTRHLRRWSADLAAALVLTDLPQSVRKRSLLRLLPSGLVGELCYEPEITFATKLLIFERALRKAGIEFDVAAL